ncbi:MAG: phosphotransferase, partial [Dermabacter sp.]|nr:phosphotransferase [Dermabacter sp.]
CRLPECVPIHGDLHFENLILVDNGSLAIIDWGAAGVGDPLYDAVAFAASLVRAGYQTAAREALETYFRLVDGSRPSGQYLQDLLCLRKLEIATHLAEVDRDGFAPSLPWVGGRISGIRADLAGDAEIEIGLW